MKSLSSLNFRFLLYHLNFICIADNTKYFGLYKWEKRGRTFYGMHYKIFEITSKRITACIPKMKNYIDLLGNEVQKKSKILNDNNLLFFNTGIYI